MFSLLSCTFNSSVSSPVSKLMVPSDSGLLPLYPYLFNSLFFFPNPGTLQFLFLFFLQNYFNPIPSNTWDSSHDYYFFLFQLELSFPLYAYLSLLFLHRILLLSFRRKWWNVIFPLLLTIFFFSLLCSGMEVSHCSLISLPPEGPHHLLIPLWLLFPIPYSSCQCFSGVHLFLLVFRK